MGGAIRETGGAKAETDGADQRKYSVIITTYFMERGKRIRIINARKATSNEEKIYHERYKEYYR